MLFGATDHCCCTVLPLSCHGPQCTLLQGDVKIKMQCSLAQPWWILTFIFARRVGERLCKAGFFFQNSFQLLLLLHCSFILEISLQPLLGIRFSIFVLIIKLIQIIFQLAFLYNTYSVNLVMFKDSFLLFKNQMYKKIRRIWYSNCYSKLGI